MEDLVERQSITATLKAQAVGASISGKTEVRVDGRAVDCLGDGQFIGEISYFTGEVAGDACPRPLSVEHRVPGP